MCSLSMSALHDQRQVLLDLSHELGAPHRQLAILGEGNTSAKLGADGFLVKASGSNLETVRSEDLVECHSAALLALLDRTKVSDDEVDQTLFDCRVDPQAKKPSVEALFHAYLLSLPQVNFVGHTHPVSVNSILCSPLAEKLATHRIFPDEVVCCGSSSVFVPYADPGLRLAQLIRDRTEDFRQSHGTPPRVILLQSHGIITLGSSAAAVKTAMFMAAKAAQIFLGSVPLGGPVFLSPTDIERIAGRRDEHHRQRALGL
jgi:rhamnose utilization protein RhaD (predicted bifunctional aldolase and dehydrogenase)